MTLVQMKDELCLLQNQTKTAVGLTKVSKTQQRDTTKEKHFSSFHWNVPNDSLVMAGQVQGEEPHTCLPAMPLDTPSAVDSNTDPVCVCCLSHLFL